MGDREIAITSFVLPRIQNPLSNHVAMPVLLMGPRKPFSKPNPVLSLINEHCCVVNMFEDLENEWHPEALQTCTVNLWGTAEVRRTHCIVGDILKDTLWPIRLKQRVVGKYVVQPRMLYDRIVTESLEARRLIPVH